MWPWICSQDLAAPNLLCGRQQLILCVQPGFGDSCEHTQRQFGLQSGSELFPKAGVHVYTAEAFRVKEPSGIREEAATPKPVASIYVHVYNCTDNGAHLAPFLISNPILTKANVLSWSHSTSCLVKGWRMFCYRYIVHCIYPCICWLKLSFFWLLITRNNATMTNDIHLPLGVPTFSPLRYILIYSVAGAVW